MDRRSLLAALGALIAGGSLPTSVRASRDPSSTTVPPSARDQIERIGLQLYTVRDLLEADFEGTLAAAAEIGYREVEFAGYFGRDPDEIRNALRRAGLTAPAVHVPLQAVLSDWERTIVTANVIGHRYLVVPSIPSNRRQTLGDYRRLANLFNRAAETARLVGLGFAYHNHAFEFEPLEGRVPYDVLVEETDPDLVLLELDLYWIRRGGGDPLEYVERYPRRFPLVHVKDMDADGGIAPVGGGVIDFARIFTRREEAGIRHFFVEHDNPRDPLASIRASYEYLRELEF